MVTTGFEQAACSGADRAQQPCREDRKIRKQYRVTPEEDDQVGRHQLGGQEGQRMLGRRIGSCDCRRTTRFTPAYAGGRAAGVVDGEIEVGRVGLRGRLDSYKFKGPIPKFR